MLNKIVYEFYQFSNYYYITKWQNYSKKIKLKNSTDLYNKNILKLINIPKM